MIGSSTLPVLRVNVQDTPQVTVVDPTIGSNTSLSVTGGMSGEMVAGLSLSVLFGLTVN